MNKQIANRWIMLSGKWVQLLLLYYYNILMYYYKFITSLNLKYLFAFAKLQLPTYELYFMNSHII